MGSLAEIIGEGGKRVLLVVAAPAEAKAVAEAFGVTDLPERWHLAELDTRFDVVVTGVSKAAAAGGAARVLDPARHGLVLSVGIAGSLGTTAVVGQTVLADRCELVDDGVQSPDGFEDLELMGFGPFQGGTSGTLISKQVLACLGPLADVIGPIATVSLCSANDPAAANLARKGYVAEGMEGAAVALVCEWVGVSFGELRVVSNTTGDRAMQRWELAAALRALTGVLGRLRTL